MHKIVIFVAQYFIILSTLTTFYVWLKLKRDSKKTFIIEGVIAGVIAIALAFIGGKLFHNPRPFVVGHFKPYFPHANDNGFPSDHMLLSSVFAFVAFKYSKLWGWVLVALAILIGASRVIAGIHHSIDIIGSVVFAAIGVAVARFVADRFINKKLAAKQDQ